jgi:hypothetical protein
MVIVQNKRKPSFLNDREKFALNAFKGNIGKAVVETYFTCFGYEICPFGYENHYANVTRFISRDPKNITISKIRTMPDLLVFDRDKRESYLIEVKACNNKKELEYWIEKGRFDNYRSFWPEAYLVVYMITSGEIYCTTMSKIRASKEGKLPNKSEIGYYIDLKSFSELYDYFPKMNRQEYIKMSKEILSILRDYGGSFLRQYPIIFESN